MEQKKGTNLLFVFIAIIVGWALFRHIDFKNLKLKEPLLDTLYFIVFAVCVYLLIKGKRNTEK